MILDWVPAHFPKDDYALRRFDGTALYEHEDPRLGEHPDWGTLIFNYGRNEVRNFLVANALYWLDEFHVDGLRVDAVASMLYLDYSRKAGQWLRNRHGGRENLEAIAFLKQFNETVHAEAPGCITIAEESTAWPGVTTPVSDGGLGFTFKWNMGWMHDTLAYFALDPVHRRFHHDQLTFAMLYEYSEHFIMPLSHDEVVHLKGSLLHKMPGDEWQKLANLRLLLAYMFTRPGKKLLFMGTELAHVGGMESRRRASTGICSTTRAARRSAASCRVSRRCTSASRRSGATIRAGRASAGSTSPTARTPCISYARRSGDVARDRHAQPHAGAARAISRRRAGGRALSTSCSRATTLEWGGSGYGAFESVAMRRRRRSTATRSRSRSRCRRSAR